MTSDEPPESTRFPVKLVEELHRALRGQNGTVAVAESCTGGLLGAAITAVPGSSDVFSGGVIAYSNAAKRTVLGVSREILEEHGAVSEPVCRRMARAVQERFDSDLGLSITGVAGPGGGTEEKPVGLVYVGVADRGREQVRCFEFDGDRTEVRARSVRTVLEEALALPGGGEPA